MKRFGLSGWVGIVLVVLLTAAETWATRPATVRGPERAFLRRGPGTEFQASTTVENGEQVTVEEVTGTWALVRTASGQSGYVHAAFLFYPDNRPVLVPTTAPTGAPAATAAPIAPAPAAAAVPPTLVRVAAATGSDLADLVQRNAELTAELEALRRDGESNQQRRPSVAAGEDVVALRAEVRRLADITDALRSRLDSPSSGTFPAPLSGEDSWGTSTVVVVAGGALLLGWVFGGMLARREERGRRNRIRF